MLYTGTHLLNFHSSRMISGVKSSEIRKLFNSFLKIVEFHLAHFRLKSP